MSIKPKSYFLRKKKCTLDRDAKRFILFKKKKKNYADNTKPKNVVFR